MTGGQESSKRRPALVMISTTDMLSDRRKHLSRMIGSVQDFADRNPDVAVRLLLLLQRCDGERLAASGAAFPAWVRLEVIDRRVSLSRARNMLIGQAWEGLADEDILCFPDDDCWYPAGTLETVCEAFSEEKPLDFWFCRYGAEPESAASFPARRPGLQDTISRASSNTIFVRGRIAKTIGGFDEGLGVGATLMGGEDTDYAIRAYYAARDRRFVDAPVVGHRDPDLQFRTSYYPGSLKAVTRYALRSSAGFSAAARKIAVGGWYVASGHMPFRNYLGALRAVIQTG
ncbi:glycosyltransferase family 2 protein [Rhizobium sp. RAF56]|uniref:glycosyltransferase family 2 protein n=1 Tax=Rhizobium sp. RAF56 TaxID=3233062 RepID=UPI003F96111D